MGILVGYKELIKISKEFYRLFENEDGIDTQGKWDLREDLDKYVADAKYNHDVAYHNCGLTYEEWAIKYGYTSDKLK